MDKLHIQSQHVIKYANGAYFNGKKYDVNRILRAFSFAFDCYFFASDTDFPDASNSIEMEKADVARIACILNNRNRWAEVDGQVDFDYIEETVGVEYLASVLHDILNYSDPNSDYVYLDWY